MPETKKYPTLVWLDLEMTGLDPDSERIIEIAVAVTNHDLTEIKEGPNLVIKQPKEFIDNNVSFDYNELTQLVEKIRMIEKELP